MSKVDSLPEALEMLDFAAMALQDPYDHDDVCRAQIAIRSVWAWLSEKKSVDKV